MFFGLLLESHNIRKVNHGHARQALLHEFHPHRQGSLRAGFALAE
jgi:hypothetical protein